MIGDEQEYYESIRHWQSQSDQYKLAVLKDLENNNWSIEYMIEQYGKKYEPIPIGFLKTEYKRLNLSPRRTTAGRQDIIDATPLKNTLLRLSEQCSVNEALAELIDNVFDNFSRKRPSNLLKISIYFHSGESGYDQIIFQENSGGARKEELIPLVRLGDTVTAGAPTIGAWGQGSKIACFALADEIEIFTHSPGEESVCIFFPDGWLRSNSSFYKSWNVEIFQAESINEGETIFSFNKLKERAREANLERIKDYLEKIYSYKLQALREEGADVSVVLEDLVEDKRYELQTTFTLENIERRYGFCWFPDYAPVRVVHSIPYKNATNLEVENKLTVTIIAGILRNSQTNLGGVYMFGNGRLFTPNPEQGDNVAFGVNVQGRRGKIRKYGPPLYRLIAFIFFECEESQSEFIPWAAPLKNRYNRNNLFHEQMMQLLYSVLYPYSLICEGIGEKQLDFFTQKWLNLSPDQKRDSLKEYFRELNNELIKKIIDYHLFECDITNLREFTYENIQQFTEAPFGYNTAISAKNFLSKLNNDRFDINPEDFFKGFFTKIVHQLVAENILTLNDLQLRYLPEPGHLNNLYIKERESEATPQYEAGTIRLEPDGKERIIRLLSLPDSSTVAEIGEALIRNVLEEGSM